MDDLDKALKALEVQIKKEIIDNYFAERRYLEEELQALDDAAAAYREEFAKLFQEFAALYEALHREEAVRGVLRVAGLAAAPFWEQYQKLAPEVRRHLLEPYPRRGLTAWRRFYHLIQDIYARLAAKAAKLQESHHKILIHLQLINEDIDKFNSSFDFGLIAAQMEAMGGGGEPISGGLLSGEREELSTRMRFKHRRLSDEELPPPPSLPPPAQIKGALKQVLSHFGP
jgi:hypothetical protein